ncbi:hypothetical protein L228DRAFT_248379 [Xylona heveae TC161]|uniref:Uncharacterized protein n=1 Tax=Xylona heveae (strain CBS 132557 / TC161) TaxID=1328760 RepID=A0A165G2G7_XYLHT|nr:hypothetical protein L228DRAFT_248379 [Xylona heveae TC161]KZF21663.1 hypothetical protein L228DRAFT_248379 [Xylona heveae TC161]
MTSTMMDDLTPNPTTAELINWAMEHALLAGKIGFKKAWESKAISGLTYLDAFDLQESDGRRVDRLPLKLVKEDNLYANLQRSLSEWNRERELYHFLSDNKSAFRRKDTMAELNIQLVAEGMSDADLEALSSAPLGVKLEELYLLKCKNEQARYIKGTFTDRLISQAPGTACPKALMIYLINDRLYPGDMRETIPISVPLITTFGMMVDVLNAYSTYNNWTVPTGISHGRGSGPAQSLTAGFDDGEIAAMDKAWCACLLEQSPKRFYSFSLDHLHQKFNPLFSEYRLSDDYNWSSLKRAMLRGGYPAVIWHVSFPIIFSIFAFYLCCVKPRH